MKTLHLKNILFFIAILGAATLANAQTIEEKFKSFHWEFFQEKVYLHLNKPHYRLGEKIWFKAYLVDGVNHLEEAKSSVVRVELLDPNGKILATRILSTMHMRMNGDFNLDPTYPPGRYTVRAYTNWMRNFANDYLFSTTFNVFKGNGLETFEKTDSTKTDLTLAFFPEGGDLIANTSNAIAVKSIGRSGDGVSVQGVISDNSGNQITTFNTNEFGFAKFDLVPEHNEEYKAQIFSSGDDYYFDLPRTLQNGIKLAIINEYESPSIKIKIEAFGIGLSNCVILIHQRGIIQFNETINTNSSSFTFDLEKSNLSPGVYHTTIFDPNKQPIVERLFAANLDSNQVKMKLIKDSVYKKDTPVHISIEVVNTNETESNGSLSVAITKENGSYYSLDRNIQNYLLLSSDLTGNIENPSFYFRDSKVAHQNLDLLMMTQGWKRFTWNEILSDSARTTLYKAEKNGIAINGNLYDFFNRSKQREGFISFSTLSSNSIRFNTDSEGFFRIPAINFADSIDLFLSGERLVNKKGKTKKDVFIDLMKIGTPEIQKYPTLADLSNKSTSFRKAVDTTNATLLDEVVVSGIQEVYKVKNPFAKAQSLYLNPSIRIIADSVFAKRAGVKNVSGYFLGLPGIAIIGSGPTSKVRLQGLGSQKRLTPTEQNTTPLYMIDGVPTNEESFFSLNPFDIYYIDILRGTQASIYGTRGSNGVIFAYLRPAEIAKKVPRPGSLLHQFPGYYKAEKFEFTDIMRANLTKDPLGITVHWEPSLKINNGKGNLHFNLPNEPGNYFIRMEGLTKQGTPLFIEEAIQVE